MDYFAGVFGLTTTHVVIVPAAEFDREVLLTALDDDIYVGFDDTNLARIPQTAVGSSTGIQTRFILAAGKDLWAKSGVSGEVELNIIVTVAR